MKKFLMILSVTVLAVAVVFSLGAGKTYKSSKYAWLGVTGESVDRELAEEYDLPVKEGAYIDDVLKDSPAEKAGLEEDDIITAVGGTRVRDFDDLVDIIDDHKPGDEITLTVMRENEKREIKATLDGRPKRESSYDYSWYSDEPIVVPRVPKIPKVPSIDRMVYIDELEGSYIGIRMTELTKQLGEYFGVEKGQGVLITEVAKESPAEKAGLKAGDVIVAMDGDKVWEFDDVRDAVDDKDEGETLSVTVVRDKSEKSFEVTVEERECDRDLTFHWNPHKSSVRTHRVIKGDGLHDACLYLDSDEFEDDMEELAEDMEELQEELEELDSERGRLQKSDLIEELERLKEELQELEEEIY